jgi:hypothetical protein
MTSLPPTITTHPTEPRAARGASPPPFRPGAEQTAERTVRRGVPRIYLGVISLPTAAPAPSSHAEAIMLESSP